MSKRSSYEIKKKILMQVKEKEATYAELERKINTGYRTIKSNCDELEDYGFIKVQEVKHPANGRLAHKVKITGRGMETIKS